RPPRKCDRQSSGRSAHDRDGTEKRKLAPRFVETVIRQAIDRSPKRRERSVIARSAANARSHAAQTVQGPAHEDAGRAKNTDERSDGRCRENSQGGAAR